MPSTAKKTEKSAEASPSASMKIPIRSFLVGLAVASAVAFAAGRMCYRCGSCWESLPFPQWRRRSRYRNNEADEKMNMLHHTPPALSSSASSSSSSPSLSPSQQQEKGESVKAPPVSIYTSKEFDPKTSSSDTVLLSRPPPYPSYDDLTIKKDPSHERYEPFGEHLMVDMEGADPGLLNSKEKLAKALLDLVNESGMTLLSYHCHRLQPVGVSCVGILLQSHVALHTWPERGVVTIDLFACGPHSVRPLVPSVAAIFGRDGGDGVVDDPVPMPSPRDDRTEKEALAIKRWKLKNRGFARKGRLVNGALVEADSDFGDLFDRSSYHIFEEVASVKSQFQSIDIFDVLDKKTRPSLESYLKSVRPSSSETRNNVTSPSYEAAHPEFFRPDRVIYLDEIVQSRYFGEGEYHEALVHPALFAHGHPKRVAIIGGGEGATLREVLKHKTVEKVTMVEIDEVMVNVSKQYLPEWSDCSNLLGSTNSCFDDPRAELLMTDAIRWFVDEFGDEDDIDEEDKYDVVIMDALYVFLMACCCLSFSCGMVIYSFWTRPSHSSASVLQRSVNSGRVFGLAL